MAAALATVAITTRLAKAELLPPLAKQGVQWMGFDYSEYVPLIHVWRRVYWEDGTFHVQIIPDTDIYNYHD